MGTEHSRPTVSQRGVVFADDAVLVVRRACDGEWELPGGRLESGEEAVGGLKRELHEETGLCPAVGDPVHTFAWRNTAGEDRFAVCYVCWAAERAVSLSTEHDGFEWVSPTMAQTYLDTPQSVAVYNAVDEERGVRTGPHQSNG